MKIYEVELHQVSRYKYKGCIKNRERVSLCVGVSRIEQKEFIPSLTPTINYIGKIIVEKISPYMVREVKTGFLLPILKVKEDFRGQFYNCQKKVHTFVYENPYRQSLFHEITTFEELEAYYNAYPSAEVLKKELSNLWENGESTMNAKLFQEEELIKISKKAYEKEWQATKEELLEPIVEKRKIRKLIRRSRQEQRKI